jgi:uncharacterized repeat protein (TIGR01451 family)
VRRGDRSRPRATAALVAAALTCSGGVALSALLTGPAAVAAQTTCPTSISLGNGDFEAPDVNPGAGSDVSDTDPAAVWQTTESDTEIEYWANGGNSDGANGGVPITAQSGDQWVELNANEPSTLYQDLTTVPGQVMHWSLWHRARYVGIPDGHDVMRVLIGDPGSPTQQGPDISDGPDAWGNATGSYVVPAGQTTTRFEFQAVSSANGNATYGNFLDDIQFANSPCLSVDKSVTDVTPGSGGLTRPGDTLRYTVRATNAGGDDASNAVLTDPVPANTTYVPGSLVVSGVAVSDAADGDTGEVTGGTVTGRVGSSATSTTGGDIATGDATTMTFEVRVDPTLPAGTDISNTVSATYQWSPSPTVLTATSNTTTATLATPGIAVVKSVTGTTDVNGDRRLDTGDTVHYAFAVTNTGSTTLTSVGVDDPVANAICPITTLAAGAGETCTGTHTVTQGDVDNSPLVNTATATGTPPAGAAPIVSAPSTATQALDQTASLALHKTGATTDLNGDGRLDLGDEVTYAYTLTNTGSVTLSTLSVNDPQTGLSPIACPATSLAAGTSTTCSASYPLVQADLDAGRVSDTATAAAQAPAGTAVISAPSTATVALPGVAALALVKSGQPADTNGDGRIGEDDTIAWTFQVTNSGAVALTDVSVTDRMAGHVTCQATTLPPGASSSCAADRPYTITAADAAAGGVHNVASATADCTCAARALVTRAAAVVVADPRTVSAAPVPVLSFTGGRYLGRSAVGGAVAVLLGVLLLVGSRRWRTGRSGGRSG